MDTICTNLKVPKKTCKIFSDICTLLFPQLWCSFKTEQIKVAIFLFTHRIKLQLNTSFSFHADLLEENALESDSEMAIN